MEVIMGSPAIPSFALSNSRRNPTAFSSEVLLLNHFPAKKSGSRISWCSKSKEHYGSIYFSSQFPNRSNRCKNFLQSLWWLDKRFVLHCSFFGLKAEGIPSLRKFSTSLRKALKRAERFNNIIPVFSVHLVVGVMIVMTLGATVTKTPSLALTEENLLFLEAWRAIDRAYVDKTFNGQSWFIYRENALRNEPMTTREETYAAIRKMVATLGDPFTRFLEPKKFKSLRAVRNTEYTYWSRDIYRIS